MKKEGVREFTPFSSWNIWLKYQSLPSHRGMILSAVNKTPKEYIAQRYISLRKPVLRQVAVQRCMFVRENIKAYTVS